MKKINFKMHHDSIATQYVFSENDQVYMRTCQDTDEGSEEWLPISFQWIPV